MSVPDSTNLMVDSFTSSISICGARIGTWALSEPRAALDEEAMSIPGPAGGGPHQQPREATTWRSRDDECGLGGVPGARGSGCPRRAKRLPRQPWAEPLADVLCRLRPAAGLGLDSLDCALCTDWPTVLM